MPVAHGEGLGRVQLRMVSLEVTRRLSQELVEGWALAKERGEVMLLRYAIL